jgi:RNA polymerase sigma factor (sigma-70 family)
VFPTTVWTTIERAGRDEPEALESFAAQYRAPVLAYLRGRGLTAADAEDLCQDVFLRVLRGKVLARADEARGRFRGLLLAVARHAHLDWLRRRKKSVEELGDVPDRDPDFDAVWAVHLAERAMERLRADGSPYHEVLCAHLAGEAQDRNRLWNARRKLVALIREEVAFTCRSEAEFEEELAYLSRYLRPRSARNP